MLSDLLIERPSFQRPRYYHASTYPSQLRYILLSLKFKLILSYKQIIPSQAHSRGSLGWLENVLSLYLAGQKQVRGVLGRTALFCRSACCLASRRAFSACRASTSADACSGGVLGRGAPSLKFETPCTATTLLEAAQNLT